MARVNLDPNERDIEKIRSALLGRVVRGTHISSPRLTPIVGIVTHVDTFVDFKARQGERLYVSDRDRDRPVVTLRRRGVDNPDSRWFDRLTWEVAE